MLGLQDLSPHLLKPSVEPPRRRSEHSHPLALAPLLPLPGLTYSSHFSVQPWPRGPHNRTEVRTAVAGTGVFPVPTHAALHLDRSEPRGVPLPSALWAPPLPGPSCLCWGGLLFKNPLDSLVPRKAP